jgi:YHS domain-containing protein
MLGNLGRSLGIAALGLAFALAAAAAEGDKPAADEGKKETKAQTTCPVMGGKINKEIFADHDGKRVYFCCKACVAEFNKDPAKYIKKLEDQGVTLEKAPAKEEAPKGDAPKGEAPKGDAPKKDAAAG